MKKTAFLIIAVFVALTSRAQQPCQATAYPDPMWGTIEAYPEGMSYQWINCGTMSEIPGATGQAYTPPCNGDYAVVVSDASCISDTSDCVTIMFLSSGTDCGFAVPDADEVRVFDLSGRETACVTARSAGGFVIYMPSKPGAYVVAWTTGGRPFARVVMRMN